eukprot:TRINITY_DN1205_c0_g1_i3.p1 TRINITY_DN1205_c0_g1~~TRINITY_DN1205_c0_g1_i3.p1  ORF type:complete len:777 (-),score=155.97 TRINITY_DN1205_c0_g1_i3:564-2894(-)
MMNSQTLRLCLIASILAAVLATPIQLLGLSDSQEIAGRQTLLFNDDWLFAPTVKGFSAPDSEFTSDITLPHTTVELPWHDFHDKEYQIISTYRKHFSVERLSGRRIVVLFDGVMLAATVYVNNRQVAAEHRGGYTPFWYDITSFVNEGPSNTIQVVVDSTERNDIPPFGFTVDYLAFGGIYRDVHLMYLNPVYIHNIFVMQQGASTGQLDLKVKIFVNNPTGVSGDYTALLSLKDANGNIVATVSSRITVGPSATGVYVIPFDRLSGAVALWSLDTPVLYAMEVNLQSGSTIADSKSTRFGFRDAKFEKTGGFFLNGKPLKLMGLNRHQTYPYIGAAAPARLQTYDADLLKYNHSLNIVRTSHYPQSTYFLDRCDEIGILVFEEIPGWQHIGNQDWKSVSMIELQAMIERDWNHPSIIMWGVRINESPDDFEFYNATNHLAHSLDPTRQTGGVRNFLTSQFLEDVYTYNDFSNTIVEPTQQPHLVTEFNGHMYPTKVYDQEERTIEHALRHARIQSDARGNSRVSGALGWCFADYNTHRMFGSGDRICYHGVSDIFRLPKLAASVYESQIDPRIRPVLKIATLWTLGDRSASGVDPIYAFSNCDYADAYVSGVKKGRFYPAFDEFPHLMYPPIKAPGLGYDWSEEMPDFQMIGYYGNHTFCATQSIAADGVPEKLEFYTLAPSIKADAADMTWVVFKVVDKFGNRLPYSTKVVSFTIEGPGRIVGDNPFALIGGQAAIFVKSTKMPGTIKVGVGSIFHIVPDGLDCSNRKTRLVRF